MYQDIKVNITTYKIQNLLVKNYFQFENFV